MDFDITLAASDSFTSEAYTLRDIIFRRLPHRSENSSVIFGHREELVEIRIYELRFLICQLAAIIKEKKLAKGDTVMLASFYSSNELANAILFAAFTGLGIRIFIPIYPEADEFENWHTLTDFKAVIASIVNGLSLVRTPAPEKRYSCTDFQNPFFPPHYKFPFFISSTAWLHALAVKVMYKMLGL